MIKLQQHIGSGFAEEAWDFLAGAEEGDGDARAEHQVPQFDEPGLFVQMRQDQIIGLQRGEGVALGEEHFGLIGCIEHQMDPG